MRELKFRAYIKHLEMMIPVDKIDFNLQELEFSEGFGCDPLEYSFKDIELMQFTGLKDKNGNEIYEGDIVRCASSRRCPHEVIWTEIGNQNLGSTPGWYLSGLGNPGYSFTGDEEIIGNIHETPELLEVDL